MFKFNKNDELLETIEKQKVQLGRYENRLRDLVSAYKSLQNEKQALESSVKALTASHAISPSLGRKLKPSLGGSKLSVSSQGSSRRSSVDTTQKKETDVTSAENAPQNEEDQSDEQSVHGDTEVEQSESEEESNDFQEELEKLRHQIATLTVSLSTVTEEKSKIVATYQAEKRKLKQDTESRLTETRREVDQLRSNMQETEEELAMAKEKVRSQQKDREQEQSTHSIMLRELQKMLNDERTKSDELSRDLQEVRKAAQKAETESRKSESSEKQLKKLMEDLEDANKKLKLAKEEAQKPSPVLVELQKSVAEMKASHRVLLEKEHLRAIYAEERLKQVSQEAEDRVSSLEEQITGLSNQMGGYESSKTKDRVMFQKLKERLFQVEAENGILAKQVAAGSAKKYAEGLSEDVESMDVEELKNLIIKYKGLLKIAAQKSDDPIDIQSWLSSIDGRGEDDYQKLYLEVQHELRQTKEEFEKYKVRAQNVLKSKRESSQGYMSGRESIANIATQQQMQDLKNELEETRERHFHLRSHCDGLEERQKILVKEHGEEMLRQHLDHQKNIEAEKEIYASKIHELEQEMRSQRERTVALLAEKDKEIQHLRAYSTACHREYQSEYGAPEPRRLSSSSQSKDYTFYGTDEKESSALDSVTEIMNKGSGQDTTMIHYAEQMARKDVSINGLRRQKKQLELQIRQLQDAIMMRDEKNSRELATLHEKIADFGRNKSRENANLEYLKNVMFQYLTTNKDHSARSRMLQAVITILQFSPEETKKVLRTK